LLVVPSAAAIQTIIDTEEISTPNRWCDGEDHHTEKSKYYYRPFGRTHCASKNES